ncbi:hypothetical protein BST97_04060 [Nonlabens spongiae]|uniref:TIGR00341 family protein n=1 Tax=Nonlabens spongiae TaxID=331648 RepID=A0A1W6MI11_9FLAO|nr:DUF389 domain-containing protein [Nonlabens spongiae]ARN77220.1 hypothetical protein BST97_04060 [Nonlabens spongiae]
MSTQPTQNMQPEDKLESNKEKIEGIWENIKAFLSELLDIRKDSDRSETVESVRKDISFQGHNAWILIFSIMVASIGLNANSTAVVIGAMLISPLMGPIVGMGLGTAINDDRMLRRSGMNLLIMVGLSLATASLYFLITPLKELNTELSARTEPNILDVLVAIFGGLALIVAKAKKGTISNAIAGVAIATALMPPLCTAGYGIATAQLSVFGGAIYLFSINAVFIALSTFVVCKFLRFPMVKYANAAKRKRVSRIAGLIGVLVLAPSIFFFIKLYQKQKYQIEAYAFVEEIVKYPGMRSTPEWNNEKKQLDVILMGAEVPQPILDDWTNKFIDKEQFEQCTIEFYQGSKTILADNNDDLEKLQEERINDIKLIQDKDTRIQALEDELRRMSKQSQKLEVISEEVSFIFPELAGISYAPEVYRDLSTSKYDTIQKFTVAFKDSTVSQERRAELRNKMKNWLTFRMKTDQIDIVEGERKIRKAKTDTIEPIKEEVKKVGAMK